MNENEYQKLIQNLKNKYISDDPLVKPQIYNKYIFYHDLISVCSFIEAQIADLYTSKFNKHQIPKINLKIKRIKEDIPTLWSIEKIFFEFFQFFKKDLNINMEFEKSQKDFKNYTALKKKRDGYAHTSEAKIEKDVLINGLEELWKLLKKIEKLCF